jgi:6-pyruvoyltetrahydropterin/6-carboxytetrahydropterin synthase
VAEGGGGGGVKTRIFVEDSFDSAHSLPHLPAEHKCHALHGHTYKIRIEFDGPIDPGTGWIVDYGVVKSYWQFSKNKVDHVFLNAIVPVSTCENLARYLWNSMAVDLKKFGPPMVKLARLELRETERCGAVIER